MATVLCAALGCVPEPDIHESLPGVTGPQGAQAQQGAAGQEVEERKQVQEYISCSICVKLVTTGSLLFITLLACKTCMFC